MFDPDVEGDVDGDVDGDGDGPTREHVIADLCAAMNAKGVAEADVMAALVMMDVIESDPVELVADGLLGWAGVVTVLGVDDDHNGDGQAQVDALAARDDITFVDTGHGRRYRAAQFVRRHDT